MKNKNTICFKSNITTDFERPSLVINPGDEMVFCGNEDDALSHYKAYAKGQTYFTENESRQEEFITDLFKMKEVQGVICQPLYIEGKIYGFFGCRREISETTTEGHFYLYETQ